METPEERAERQIARIRARRKRQERAQRLNREGLGKCKIMMLLGMTNSAVLTKMIDGAYEPRTYEQIEGLRDGLIAKYRKEAETARRAVEMHRQGMVYMDIAKELGIAFQTVSDMIIRDRERRREEELAGYGYTMSRRAKDLAMRMLEGNVNGKTVGELLRVRPEAIRALDAERYDHNTKIRKLRWDFDANELGRWNRLIHGGHRIDCVTRDVEAGLTDEQILKRYPLWGMDENAVACYRKIAEGQISEGVEIGQGGEIMKQLLKEIARIGD